MGNEIGDPPPLLPRLDLPYFNLLPHFNGDGMQGMLMTAAPSLGLDGEPTPYGFELQSYGGLVEHLAAH